MIASIAVAVCLLFVYFIDILTVFVL